jgi:hypothetical protein
VKARDSDGSFAIAAHHAPDSRGSSGSDLGEKRKVADAAYRQGRT